VPPLRHCYAIAPPQLRYCFATASPRSAIASQPLRYFATFRHRFATLCHCFTTA